MYLNFIIIIYYLYPSATCSYHSILLFWDLSVWILLVSFLCCTVVHCVNTLQFNYLLFCQQVLTAFSSSSLFTTILQWILCFLFLHIRVSLSTHLGVELYFLDLANLLFTMAVSVYITSRLLFLCNLAKFVLIELKKKWVVFFLPIWMCVMLYLNSGFVLYFLDY